MVLHGNAVSVESSDVIRGEHRRLENVVSSLAELEQEYGYVEVTLPSRSRKGPVQIHAAKILLFGDVYRDLVVKKEAFKKGNDIWSTSTTPAKKVSQTASKTTPKKAATKKAAAVKINENLKTAVTSRRAFPPDDSDETDIDTELDLFDTQRWARKRPIIESDEEETGTSGLQQKGPVHYTLLDEDTANALKELPSVLSSVKDALHAIKVRRSISSSPSTSDDCSPPEMISLGGSDLKVPKKVFDRLNRSRLSLFVQDLAVLIFGKDTLRNSTLTGKSGKEMLDPEKLNILIGKLYASVDTVLERFPSAPVSEIRSFLRRKCNNESYAKKV
ncbi:hypothetical protein WMY93_031358 [Mugilogobius chulae]|uniref:BEN domain-containing protein n=1 Tax=Mugilogobius chulae TaxID=88201 RepID=A0AAW0MI94_9GOBI